MFAVVEGDEFTQVRVIVAEVLQIDTLYLARIQADDIIIPASTRLTALTTRARGFFGFMDSLPFMN